MKKCSGSHMYCTQAVEEVSPSREITFSERAWQMVSGSVPELR